MVSDWNLAALDRGWEGRGEGGGGGEWEGGGEGGGGEGGGGGGGGGVLLTPKRTYVAITEPAIVAYPPTMTACSSDVLIRGISGRINSGASV